MTENELFNSVCDCIRGTLERDLPEIKESSRLIADLGVDSLDFLDLIFRLEKHFAVRINPRDIERRTQSILGDAPMLVDGCYTEAAIIEFRKAMPEVPEAELYAGMPMAELMQSFRVKTFMNLVEYALNEGKI